MTKKDYIALAAALKAEVDGSDNDYRTAGIEAAAKAMASVLRADNPRFDRDKFLAACGFTY